LIFFMVFLFTAKIASQRIKTKNMKKINSTSKFQFLNVDNFEIVLKFLNFDDLAHFLRSCEKSKSNYLKQTIRKIFQTFHKNQIQKSIEYLSSERFHARKPHKNSSTKFFEKYVNSKTISLPKFVEHVIQTPQLRFVSHIDGFFSIEQKLQNEKQYTIMSIQTLFFKNCKTSNTSDSNTTKLLNLIFSSKHFITSILNQQDYISIIFQAGEILICGKTGKARMSCYNDESKTIFHFLPENKSYFMYIFEISNTFVVYHISSGELFYFDNYSSLKSIFLNPNSIVDYDFFKNNAKSSKFANSTNFLSRQMMTYIYKMKVNKLSMLSHPKQVNEVLNEIANI